MIRLTLIIALMGVIHHYIVSGRLVDWEALYHHEPIIVGVLILGLGIFIGRKR